MKQLKFTQDASGWHLSEFQQPYNPMDFYMQNPELMKRYFPHLVPEHAEHSAATEGE